MGGRDLVAGHIVYHIGQRRVGDVRRNETNETNEEIPPYYLPPLLGGQIGTCRRRHDVTVLAGAC